MRNRAILTAAFLAITLSSGHSETPKELESRLRGELKNRVVILRTFYVGDELHFNQGSLVGPAATGPWTTASRLKISDVKVRNDKIEITGRRVWVTFDSSGHKEILLESDRRVEIVVDIPSLADPNQVDRALLGVFATPSEKMVELVPDIWKEYFEKGPDPVPEKLCSGCAQNENGKTTYRIGGKVTPPRPKHTPDPGYTPEARKAKFNGSLLLAVTVTEEGKTADVHVRRPAGLGLDERAIEYLKAWEFEPARRDGVPVPVKVTVEVNFRIYQ